MLPNVCLFFSVLMVLGALNERSGEDEEEEVFEGLEILP
jgi:hypothetical protein